MPTPAATTDPTAAGPPPTCEIRGWSVFASGFHKGDLYPREDLRRMEANFRLLSDPRTATYRAADGTPFLTPNVKLGHDLAQRYARSLGFPATGKVADVRAGDAAGELVLWLTGVPTTVGAAVNAEFIRSGSIDLKKAIPDPADPAKVLPGPVLEGVSLLGDEQPAVKGRPRPVAVFADGTPVPPMADLADWLTAMFEAERAAATAPPDPAAAGMSVCFSDTPPANAGPVEAPPVTPEELIAAFQALSPEQQAQVKAQMGTPMADAPPPAGGAAPPPAPPAAPAPGPAPGPAAADDPMAKMAAFMSDCTKRMGDLEAALKAKDKAADEEKMSAAVKMSEQAVDAAIRAGRVYPADRALFVQQGAGVLATKTFGATSGDGAFAAWTAALAARPASPLLAPAVREAPAGQEITPAVRRQASHTDLGRRTLAKLEGAAH